MGSRYADDVKRIVGIDPNQSALDAAIIRNAHGLGRGIGYNDPTSGQSATLRGTSQQTTLDGSQNSSDFFEFPDLDDASTMTSSDIQTAADIIDGEVDPNNLQGISAVDCTTGDDIEILTRAEFIPPDAVFDSLGVEISGDWADADTPPQKIGWTSGKQWGLGASPTVWFATTVDAIQSRIDLLEGGGNVITGRFWVTGNYTDGGTYKLEYLVGGVTPASQTFPIGFQACTPDDNDATCPATAPAETEWPADGQYSLRFEDGKFVTSTFDSEAPLKYQAPVGRVDFCFGAGGARTGTMEATKDNGYMIYETDAGSPIGIARVYNTEGEKINSFEATTDLIVENRPI